MVKTASIFSQLLRFFPQTEFTKIVKKHSAVRDATGFTSWTQFVSMLFCRLAGAESLRKICTGSACRLGKLRHWGLPLGTHSGAEEIDAVVCSRSSCTIGRDPCPSDGI